MLNERYKQTGQAALKYSQIVKSASSGQPIADPGLRMAAII
jgi:hypothetical protein